VQKLPVQMMIEPVTYVGLTLWEIVADSFDFEK
jgi:hypothetical protein